MKIGLLWGDFPWELPPPKVDKLLSSGVVGRNVARALRPLGTVVPYVPAEGGMDEEQLSLFLRSVDVLWADLYPTSADAVRLRHELNLDCRIILYAGGTLPKAAEAMLFPWQPFLRPGDNLLVTCRADLEIWHRLVAWSRLREWVVPLPVDETVFRPDGTTDRAAVRARQGLPLDSPLLLYVGRLNIQKNLHTLLRILAGVRLQVPGTHLCLVGETDDIMLAEFGVSNTGYMERLRVLAKELDVADAVTVLPPRFGSDLAALYRAADVVVNASLYHRENFGLSQAEAQACGVPVVCSDWGGFRDVVRHGDTGFLMETVISRNGVRVDWASGIKYVTSLLQDEDLRLRMGERAAVWARKHFSIPVFASRLGRIVGERGADPEPSAPLSSATPESNISRHHLLSRRDGVDVPYEPSDFARRYEGLKAARGWYAPGTPARSMFQGESHALYEEMMHPYATRLARDAPISSLAPSLVPYKTWTVRIDGHTATCLDPIWRHERAVSAIERESLSKVDGRRSLVQIADELSAPADEVQRALYSLCLDGFILFEGVR